jgi:hypothetical protein
MLKERPLPKKEEGSSPMVVNLRGCAKNPCFANCPGPPGAVKRL